MDNVLEKLRSGETLTAKDKLIHEQGLVSVLKQIHDDLDAATFEAYGWPASLTDDEILERLVALNAERAEEESRGIVRWLRPEFQSPDAAKGPRAKQETLAIVEEAEPEPETAAKSGRKGKKGKAAPAAKAEWPSGLPEQAQAVRNALAAEPDGASPEALARRFARARVDRVRSLLETLASLGQARKAADGRYLRT